MKTPILAFLCALSTAFLASGQVPSLINYQGRLTDANGAAVTGNKNFSINIFDAATGGNLLYSETIGAVTLDSNGVYSFQFGSAGTSNKQVTETIGTTAGTTLVYSKDLANSSVVNNSITVTDGTNSWSQSVGNPGAGATATANTIVGFVIGATITNGGSGYTSAPEVTISGSGTGATATATLTDGVITGINIVSAGSGYTTGATITIAPPVIPFRVEYASGTITATYANAPTAGRTIAANYRYGTGGIADALGNAGEHWMAITVDGVTQGTRQRVLAVPFAQQAAKAGTALRAPLAENMASEAANLAESAIVAAELGKANISTNQSSQTLSEFFTDSNGFYNTVTNSNLYATNFPIACGITDHTNVGTTTDYNINSTLRFIEFAATSGSGSQYSPSCSISGKIFYNDSTSQNFEQNFSFGYYSQGQSSRIYIKPNSPGKTVTKISILTNRSVAISHEVRIWDNSERTIECSIPPGFLYSNSQFKAILSYDSLESGSVAVIQLINTNLEAHTLTDGWNSIPTSHLDSNKLRIKITAPAASISETSYTKPRGIVILRK